MSRNISPSMKSANSTYEPTQDIKRIEFKLWNLFHKACADYRLLEDGDRVLIGLSGGKDSLALVELLGRQSAIHKPHIEVCAVHIRQEHINYISDTDYLAEFCHAHNVPLHIRTTGYEMRDNSKRSHCFMCSWTRRKMLFETAKELNCNKIALGHHKDDIAQTALLNLFFQGNFDSIAPTTVMNKFPMTLIRPLCLINERDVALLAQYHNYQSQQKACPYEHESMRDTIKHIITEIEHVSPYVKENIWHALNYTKLS